MRSHLLKIKRTRSLLFSRPYVKNETKIGQKMSLFSKSVTCFLRMHYSISSLAFSSSYKSYEIYLKEQIHYQITLHIYIYDTESNKILYICKFNRLSKLFKRFSNVALKSSGVWCFLSIIHMFKLLQDISYGLKYKEKKTNVTVKQILNESSKMTLRNAG